MSPTSTALGALWLEFHKSSSASDPDSIVVQFKRLQLAEDPVSQRWRHTTTEVTCQGKETWRGFSPVTGMLLRPNVVI